MYISIFKTTPEQQKLLSGHTGNTPSVRVKYKYPKPQQPAFVDSRATEYNKSSHFVPAAWVSEFQAEVKYRLIEYINQLADFPPEVKRPEVVRAFAEKYELGDFRLRRDRLTVTVNGHEFSVFVGDLGIDYKARNSYIKHLHDLVTLAYITKERALEYIRLVSTERA